MRFGYLWCLRLWWRRLRRGYPCRLKWWALSRDSGGWLGWCLDYFNWWTNRLGFSNRTSNGC